MKPLESGDGAGKSVSKRNLSALQRAVAATVAARRVQLQGLIAGQVQASGASKADHATAPAGEGSHATQTTRDRVSDRLKFKRRIQDSPRHGSEGNVNRNARIALSWIPLTSVERAYDPG